MLLFNIIGLISINITIYFTLVFMKSEMKSDYIWVLLVLREILKKENLLVYLRVMVSNREKALILAS